MQVREKKEQNKSRQRFWEMAGSKMGQITGACQIDYNVARPILRHQPARPATCLVLGQQQLPFFGTSASTTRA